MSTALKPIDVNDVPDVLKEIEEAFFDIPFENSAFQNEAFVVAAQQTPARAYRTVGLRMFSKIQAVKESLYQAELKQIDIEEKEEMLNSPDLTKFEKRRLELELKKLKDDDGYAKKLLNDAIVDLNQMYAIFKKLPEYSRETFEAEEYNHFNLRLNRQLQVGGAGESILNMTEDLPQFPARIEKSLSKLLSGDLPKMLRVTDDPPADGSKYVEPPRKILPSMKVF